MQRRGGIGAMRTALFAMLAGLGVASDAWAQGKSHAAARSSLPGKAAAAMTAAAVRFVPVSYADVPGWTHDDHLAALRAFLASCPQLIKASKAGNKASAVPTPPALIAACDDALRLAEQRLTPAVARSFFEKAFTPHRVQHGAPEGLLTGYYEPVISGSRTPTTRFPTPLHRRPADLVNIVDETMRGAKADSLTHGRKTGQGVQPFPTRAEIDQGALKGQGLEMLYLAGPVERFFMQVQGSGQVKLADGTVVRVTYDGKNGHPYTSIGRHLIDTGQLAADKMSLDALGKWLKSDPARGQKVMELNKSYVFFREVKPEEANGALGVLHIPLTPGRSLAVDAGVHAIGTPIYVSAPSIMNALQVGGFNRLMVAHDVGSAIRGPERGDIYFGSGDEAGKLAGITKHPGNFFVLLPHGLEAPLRPTQAAEAANSEPPATSPITTGSISQRAEP